MKIIILGGDGYLGWAEHAPFDAIIVTAAPDQVPQILIDQVKIGGKLVLPVGTYFQKLKLITKLRDGKIEEETVTSVRFVPMVHFDKTPQNDSNVRLTK